MAQVGIGAGEGAVGGALSGALSGTAAGSAGGPPGWIVGAIVGAVLGALSGAASLLINKPVNTKPRKNNDLIDTSSIRTLPVGLGFGRFRAGGNWIAVGNFLIHKDNLDNTPGRRLFQCNAVLALCEGPIPAMGNVWQDGQRLTDLANAENLDVGTFYQYVAIIGTNAETVNPIVALPKNGYVLPNIPYRNTSNLIVRSTVGTTPVLPSVNIDMVGPDLTIRRSGTTGESAPGDVLTSVHFDSYSESFYYTISASSATSAPFGLVGIGRQGQPRSHTAPPTGESSVTNAWYIGLNDVLVMQSSSDSATFFIGAWGMPPTPASPTDPTWEKQKPIPEQGGSGYEHPMLCWHLDEDGRILHSLHDDGTSRYIMKWWFLSGRVTRMNTVLATGTFHAMTYSKDLNCYIFGSDSNRLDFIEVVGGTLLRTSNPQTTGLLGLFISGQLVGMVKNGGLQYYDLLNNSLPNHGPYDYGTSAAGQQTLGDLGNVVFCCQNTVTGHVTLGKNFGGQALLINFIGSIIEDKRDLEANGTSGLGSLPDPNIIPGSPFPDRRPEPDFQDFTTPGTYFCPGDEASGWARDWSWRSYNGWNLVALQGHSSLAAAAWATLVDEPGLDSKRWGGGLNAKYFNLGSFEGVHAFCVGARRFVNPDKTFRYAESAKFDFFVDQEISLSSFIASEILMTVGGYRYTVSGVMHIGVDRPGSWPSWHFTERQIAEDSEGSGISSLSLRFAGRTDAPNRVRVQYRDVLNEYVHDIAEASDEWDINARGKVQMVTIAVDGCGRYDSADLLAKQTLDQTKGARIQVQFKTHFVAWVLSATDQIEVSDSRCALDRLPCKINSIVQTPDGKIEIVAVEHRPSQTPLLAAVIPDLLPGSGPPPQFGPDVCQALRIPLGVESGPQPISWLASGQAFSAGPITVSYIIGAYGFQFVPGATHSDNFYVGGFDVVTFDASGNLVVLGLAPAATGPWLSYNDAVAANTGQTATFTLAVAGPVGLRYAGNANVQQAFFDGVYVPILTYDICVQPIL